MSNLPRIERLLRPRTVAVLGASSTPGSLGASVVSNLERMGFGGEIFLINPKRDRIGERTCLASVDQLPEGVDVAVLAIPGAAVLESMQALARRKVGSAVIFAAGFAEGGDAGGEAQHQLASLALDNDILIEGPNCLGFVNYIDQVALTFVEAVPKRLEGRRGVGIVSQSGAMACVLTTILQSRDIPLTYSVSTGNEAASGVEDYLEYLLADPNTSVIAMIVEQFRKAPRFLQLARRARERGIPIVLLHPGRSSAARKSAATHTGAMAGDYEVMLAHVESAGVLVADNLQEFADLLEIIYHGGNKTSPGTLVLTESGAFKALALDLCELTGLELPAIDDTDSKALRAVLPPFVPVSNPIDLTAQGLVDPDLYRRTLEALATDTRFGTVVISIIQTDEHTADIKLPHIIKALKEHKRAQTVVFAGLDEGAAMPARYIAELRALNVPYFSSPDRAFRALARLRAPSRESMSSGLEPIRLTTRPPTGTLAEFESKDLLASLSIPFPPRRMTRSLSEAQAAFVELGGLVVLKGQSRRLPHKSDAGAVLLNVDSPAALSAAWQRLHDNVSRYDGSVQLDGVLVERMSAKALELIIGGRNDPYWGPTLLVGLGGVQAELMHDFQLLSGDAGREDIRAELDRLKGAPLLHGYRGSAKLDFEAVIEIMLRIGALLHGEGNIKEIDLNPVFVYPEGQGAVALDALIVTE